MHKIDIHADTDGPFPTDTLYTVGESCAVLVKYTHENSTTHDFLLKIYHHWEILFNKSMNSLKLYAIFCV